MREGHTRCGAALLFDWRVLDSNLLSNRFTWAAASTIRLWRGCYHRYEITQTVGQLKYQFTPGKHVRNFSME